MNDPLAATVSEAMDDRLALAGVLQELTVAALDLFDPAKSVDEFLQTVAARIGCRVAVCLWVKDGAVSLLGSAGLARTSRAYRLPETMPDGLDVPLPYPEVADPHLLRWTVRPPHPALESPWWLVLYFDSEPRLARQYRGMLEGLMRQVGFAFEHRRLFERLVERERNLVLTTAHLQTLNRELERRVSLRTRQLEDTNAELTNSLNTLTVVQQRLAQSDRMASVGTLAAGVAHEINTPLAYLLCNLELILQELDAIESNAAAKAIGVLARDARQGAQSVSRIVNGLKTFSRSDHEQRVPIDLHGVLETSISMAFNEVRHRAGLEKDLGPVPLVEGDETRLGQVFINLLVNAAQAIPAGHAHKNTIRVVTRTDPTGRAVVEVQDTGSGIPPELLAHVFDPFFTTKEVGVGTGLGLSICHGIVTAAGGEIAIESEVGRGTIVRVTLPPASNAECRVVETPTPVATHAGRASILIVDDDPMLRASIARVLRRHDVTVATSGIDALLKIRTTTTFDMVLCDLMMPEMTGMDFHAEVMQANPKLADRIVFMTGGAFTAPARAFLERVPNERIDKPFNLTKLHALVGRFLRTATPQG